MWDDYMGARWQPGDIYSLDLVRQLRASGRQASRSTVGKWLREMAERGELVEVPNVIHPINKRRCTVYRPVRKPTQVPAMPAASGGNGTDGRRDGGGLHQSSLPAASPRNRKGKKTP